MAELRILLVDGDPNILSALRRVLTRSGYQVRTTASPREALKQLDDVAIVFSELTLPEMTGIDFLRQVRERRPHCTRYVLTGAMERDATTAAIREGTVMAVLRKPWHTEALLEAIVHGFLHYSMRESVDRMCETSRD